MTTVGAGAFRARLEAMVSSQNQRKQLLEAETEIYIAQRKEYREQQSRGRQVQHIGLKFYVKAEEITWKSKAIEEERDAAILALNDLELKQRSLSEELFRFQKKRDDNLKFYECHEAEMRNFKLQMRDCQLTIQTEIADELKCDLQRVTQVDTASDCDMEDGTEINDSGLVSAKQASSSDVCSNLHKLGILEKRLHEALLRSDTRKRDLATSVEALKSETTVLQTTEKDLEDQVLQAITRRDKRKRELYELECQLGQKKKSFYGSYESQTNVGELGVIGRSQEKPAGVQ